MKIKKTTRYRLGAPPPVKTAWAIRCRKVGIKKSFTISDDKIIYVH